jgi:hypothetical protein
LNVQEFIALLEGRDLRPKPTGPGKWQSLCPAHKDRVPSLSIGTGADERILLRCHADCGLEEIVARLGLESRDLFAPNGDRPSEAIAEYFYTDELGRTLFKVVRKPGKQFPQARPDGSGGWIWKLDRTRRVL